MLKEKMSLNYLNYYSDVSDKSCSLNESNAIKIFYKMILE